LLFAMVLYLVRIESEPDLHIRELLFWKNRGSERPVDSPGQQDVNDRQVPATSIPVALLCLYMGSILSGFIFRGSLTFFPALFKENIYFITTNDEPVVIAGFVTTAVLSLGLIGSWFGGYINDKIKRPEIFPVIIFVIISMVLYLVSRFTDSWLLAVASVFSLIYYAWQPSHNYLIAKYTRKASHGMGFGVNFFLIFGIGSVATALGGFMADNYGVDSFYWLMAIIAVAALVAASMVVAVRRFHIKIVWQLVKESAE
jgi:MFS family permease